MAIFRDGVKIGNKDIRTGLTKERGQGILRKVGILPDDKGRKKFEKDAMGDVQTIRTIVGMGEGFTMPVNFKCSFYQMDMGIDQPKYSAGSVSVFWPNRLSLPLNNNKGDRIRFHNALVCSRDISNGAMT